jgi:A/G-specific adenine glycosylase
VLSIAYGVPLAALDGNIARVLARVTALRGDLREPLSWRGLGDWAATLLARNAAGDWNQALMELGETICTPQIPRCGECPVSRWCRALELNIVDKIPAPRKKRSPVKIRIAAAILMDQQGRTLLVKDPGDHDDVLFSRMWQFPAVHVKTDPRAELAQHLRNTLGLEIAESALEPLSPARHAVTFRNITLLPFLLRVPQVPKLARTRTLALSDLSRIAVSSATRKIASAAKNAP